MITVTVIELNRTGKDLSDDIVEIPVANALASAIGDKIAQRFKDFVCEDHLDFKNVLIVKADTSTNAIIDKSGFCCDKLRNRVIIKLS
jgi:hypothetical protein